MTPHDPRPLAAREWARLARLGLWARAPAVRAARDTALATAVAAAQACRAAGAGWAEIALALGIAEAELRRWRLSVTWDKPPLLAHPKAFAPGRGRHDWHGNVVLLMAGTMKTNDCDFVTEIAAIRRSLRPASANDVVERFDIEITDIATNLNEHQPAVLHLAAHHDDGLVHLCLDGVLAVVQSEAVRRAIESARSAPILAVFSMCHSDYLATDVAEGIASVAAAIGWRGQVLDDQTAAFGVQFYRNLAAGTSIGGAFDLAQIAVTTTWPDRRNRTLPAIALVSHCHANRCPVLVHDRHTVAAPDRSKRPGRVPPSVHDVETVRTAGLAGVRQLMDTWRRGNRLRGSRGASLSDLPIAYGSRQ